MTSNVCVSAWLFVMVGCAGEATRDATHVVEQPQSTHVVEQPQSTVADAGSCEDATRAVIDLLSSAVEAAPKACSSDDQCILFAEAICLASCGFYVAVTDATGIQEANQTAMTELCPNVCPQVPLPCTPSGEPTARCISEECALVYERDHGHGAGASRAAPPGSRDVVGTG